MHKTMKKPYIAVAPMMDYTDRHDRYFLRLLSPHVKLYTEMITTYALIHGDKKRLLAFHPAEKYLALQLGGSCPKDLTKCACLGEEFGYDEINLNVGCPSSRVSAGRFGACLMLEPVLVAECVTEMQAAVKIPVTVKCRIGVDDHDSIESLQNFIQLLTESGCQTVIIHARKAWLKGLSPKENREIPPLKYEVVHQIKKDFPMMNIILNGGIQSLQDVEAQLPYVDGVMIGRSAYSNPYLLAEIESYYFSTPFLSRFEVIQKFLPYVADQLKQGVKLSAMTRHILGLFQGQKGAAHWRRFLSQNVNKANAGVHTIEEALMGIAV